MTYYFFMDNEKTRVFTLTKDSLCFSELKELQITGKKSYAVAEIRKKNNEIFVIARGTKKTRLKTIDYYSVFPLRISDDKLLLRLVEENKLMHSTVKECDSAIVNFQFDKKYADTYYSEQLFASYKKLRKIEDVDSGTIQNMHKELKKRIKSSRPLIHNTETLDLYGVGTLKDILNGILVENLVSPETSITKLGNRAVQLKVDFGPSEPIRRSYIDTRHNKPGAPIEPSGTGTVKKQP